MIMAGAIVGFRITMLIIERAVGRQASDDARPRSIEEKTRRKR